MTRRISLFETLESRNLLTTFVVDSLTDGTLEQLAGDGKLSLREAIEASSKNISVDGSPPGEEGTIFAQGPRDQIVFSSELSGTIDLIAGELVNDDDVNIEGPGGSKVVIDASHRSRVFRNLSGILSIRGLTLLNGKALASDHGGHGGIVNQTGGSVSLIRSFLSGGVAEGNGGALWAGSVFVWNSTIADSVAAGVGGASYSRNSTSYDSSTIVGNHADISGAIYSENTVGLTHSTIVGNSAVTDAAGVHLIDSPWHNLDNTIIAGNFLDSGDESNVSGHSFSKNTSLTHNNLVGEPGTSELSTDRFGANLINVDWRTVVENDGNRPILRDNLGNTPTVALIHDGPAIDAGKKKTGNPPEFDQRGVGYARNVDGNGDGERQIDIGAFESHGPDIRAYVTGGNVVNESDPYIEFTVGIDRHIDSGAFSVDFRPIEDTAYFNDFESTTTTITFRPGESLTRIVQVPISQDARPEVDEILLGSLDNPAGGVIDPDRTTAPGTILGNDLDKAQVVLDSTAVQLVENGEPRANINVRLATPPNDPVRLRIRHSQISPAPVRIWTPILQFDDSNWDIPQAIEIQAIDDQVDRGDLVQGKILIVPEGDQAYFEVPTELDVAVEDNDTLGIDITPLVGETSESGGTFQFSVVLKTSPSRGTIFIPISSSDESEGTVSTNLLRFDAPTFNTPQIVTVTGVDDSSTDGHINYSINLGPIENAREYNDLVIPDVNLINIDDEVPLDDFGDAPVSPSDGVPSGYPTTLAQNGARHRTGDLFLGNSVDAEFDGQPSPGAGASGTGDDGAGQDDEDGVRFLAGMLASAESNTTSSIEITASQSGRVDAWIDFNRDGDWNDAGEQILSSIEVLAGANFSSIAVPGGAQAGLTFARFRISSAGGLSPGSAAPDGEVEDYLVELLQPGPTTVIDVLADQHHDLDVHSADNGSVKIVAGTMTLFEGAGDQYRIRLLGSDQDESIRLMDSAVTLGTRLMIDAKEGNDRVILEGAEHQVDLSDLPAGTLAGIEEFDIGGDGANTANFAASFSEARTRVKYDHDDQVDFGNGLLANRPAIVDSIFLHILSNEDASVEVQVENARAFENPLNSLDVNSDGVVAPGDVLQIVNMLNSLGSGQLQTPSEIATDRSFSYVDTNGDNFMSPIDALLVINHLNSPAGEGESAAEIPYAPPIDYLKKKKGR